MDRRLGLLGVVGKLHNFILPDERLDLGELLELLMLMLTEAE